MTSIDELFALTQKLQSEIGVPGVAVGVIADGDEHLRGFGVTSVEHPLPITPDTPIHIGSTTKTMTAMAAVCSGVDLDAPVGEYMPVRLSDEAVAARLTMRHLLTHTAGFEGDLFEDTGRGDDALHRYAELIEDLDQVVPLGVWSYCNAGFSLAGHALQSVARDAYESIIRDVVLEPLGMDRSFFFAEDAITHGAASGHSRGRVVRPWSMPRAANPAGGLTSSVRDQLRYAKFHLGDDPVAVQMRVPQAEAGGGHAVAVGLSWLLQLTPGLIVHGGSIAGQESSFAIVPDRGFALVILTNAAEGAALHRQVTRWAMREMLGLHAPKPSLEPVDPSTLADYTGHYEALLYEWDVALAGGALTLSGRTKPSAVSPEAATFPKMPVAVYDSGAMRVLGGPMKGNFGDFGRRDDGTVGWIRLGGRAARKTTPEREARRKRS